MGLRLSRLGASQVQVKSRRKMSWSRFNSLVWSLAHGHILFWPFMDSLVLGLAKLLQLSFHALTTDSYMTMRVMHNLDLTWDIFGIAQPWAFFLTWFLGLTEAAISAWAFQSCAFAILALKMTFLQLAIFLNLGEEQIWTP